MSFGIPKLPLQDLAEQRSGPSASSFILDDGVSFVHIASIERSDGRNPLSETAAFKAFQAGIRDRCEEGPVAVTLEEIGSYRMLGA